MSGGFLFIRLGKGPGGSGGGGGGSSPSFSLNPWREIDISTSANPFASDSGLSDTKHSSPIWVPTMDGGSGRVLMNAADTGNVHGIAQFGQPRSGGSSQTNAPSPTTYTIDSGYRKDHYSLDPYAANPNPYRLEHPYWPRNLGGGVREVRPPMNCQDCLVYDSTHDEIRLIQTHIRPTTSQAGGIYGGPTDEWAYGDLNSADVGESPGVYLFAPGSAGVGYGTWTKETSNALTAPPSVDIAAPTYDGTRLRVGAADERMAFLAYDATTDLTIGMTAATGFGSGNVVFVSYSRATKLWEWRSLAAASTGWSYIGLSSSQMAVCGRWLYGVCRTKENSGANWRSRLFRMNIDAVLGLANQATIPNTTSYWKSYILPFSVSGDATWESQQDTLGKVQEHAGVVENEGRVYIIASYDGLVDAEGTKHAIFAPSTELFYVCDDAPDSAIIANAWCALPDSSEVFFTHGTGGYRDDRAWAYRPTHIGPLTAGTLNTNEGTDPITNGDSGGLAYWTSMGVTPDGKLIAFGAGTHSGNIDNGVREWNPNVGGSSTYVKATNNSTCDVQQYNNHAWFFFGGINSVVVPSQGVYDRNVGDWVAGDLARCSGPAYSKVAIGTGSSAILYADSTVDFNSGTGKWDYINGGSTLYNAHTAYSNDYDCAVIIGGTPGTASGVVPNIHLIVPSVSGINSTAVSQGNRYTIYRKGLPTTVSGEQPYKGRARDACAFAGEYVYWCGGDDPDTTGLKTAHFWRMKITPHLTSKTASLTTGTGAIERLTDAPHIFTFGLMMFDPWLNAFLLVTEYGIYAYDLTYSTWSTVTPSGYDSALFDNKGMPFGCMGGFIDTTGTTTHRRFYWRPGYNQISAGQFWDDVPLVAKRITIMSLNLKRS